jgi:hypothetical protein
MTLKSIKMCFFSVRTMQSEHINCNFKFGSHLLFIYMYFTINWPVDGAIARVPRKRTSRHGDRHLTSWYAHCFVYILRPRQSPIQRGILGVETPCSRPPIFVSNKLVNYCKKIRTEYSMDAFYLNLWSQNSQFRGQKSRSWIIDIMFYNLDYLDLWDR